jgi:hypothetical protein
VQCEVHSPPSRRTAIDPVRLCDHRRGHLQTERFLRAESTRRDRGLAGVDPLAAQRRLLIDDPEVREVVEGDQ